MQEITGVIISYSSDRAAPRCKGGLPALPEQELIINCDHDGKNRMFLVGGVELFEEVKRHCSQGNHVVIEICECDVVRSIKKIKDKKPMKKETISGYITEYLANTANRSIDVTISKRVPFGIESPEGIRCMAADIDLFPKIKDAYDRKMLVFVDIDDGEIIGIKFPDSDQGAPEEILKPEKYWVVRRYKEEGHAHNSLVWTSKEKAIEEMQREASQNDEPYVVLEAIAHCRPIRDTETSEL